MCEIEFLRLIIALYSMPVSYNRYGTKCNISEVLLPFKVYVRMDLLLILIICFDQIVPNNVSKIVDVTSNRFHRSQLCLPSSEVPSSHFYQIDTW